LKVWIVTQTSGDTIEGDTEVRAVYSNEGAAREAEAALESYPGDPDAGAGEYEVQDSYDPERLELSAWER
jgi:hypothetical protein